MFSFFVCLFFQKSVFLNKVNEAQVPNSHFIHFCSATVSILVYQITSVFHQLPNSLEHSGLNRTVTFETTFMVSGAVLGFTCYLTVRLMPPLCLNDYSYKVGRISCKKVSSMKTTLSYSQSRNIPVSIFRHLKHLLCVSTNVCMHTHTQMQIGINLKTTLG